MATEYVRSTLTCALSGIDVETLIERQQDPGDEFIAHETLLALGHLLRDDDLSWCKVATIKGPDTYYLIITDQDDELQEQLEDLDVRHGDVFSVGDEIAFAPDEETPMVRGTIGERLRKGTDWMATRQQLDNPLLVPYLEILQRE